MEDKLSSKESHVWTLSDFIERRKDWDQGDEARLAEYLQQLSNKITLGAKTTLNALDDLVASIDDTAIQVANINNEFQLLADKQFIENKVQEEDETVQIKVEKPVAHEINNADVLVNSIKEALKNSFKAVDNHFEKITVVVSDSDDDELKHEETILRPKIFYKKLNLPSLSGNIQSEIPIDNTLSSDSDVEPPSMDIIKEQESFSSDDVPEEEVNFINESKNTVEPNHQTFDSYSNFIEPEKIKSKNVSSDIAYVENDLFSPPPLLNDNDEDDLVNEYNIFSNGSNLYGERNLWDDDDDDDDDDADFEPPLPVYTDEPPQQDFKSNTQEKVPSIQQTLNDELRKRFQKDNMSSSSDNANIESLKTKLPTRAVNDLCKTDSESAAQSPVQNIKQPTLQIRENVPQPIQYNTVSDIRKDNTTSNKLFTNPSQNETFTHQNLKEEIKSIKKRSLFEQESDDEDLFAAKVPSVIPVSKTDEPLQRKNSVKNIKESKIIFSKSDEEFMDSKSTTKEIFSQSIENKSTTCLDSSSDDDLFKIKSSSNKSIFKQKLSPVKNKSISHVAEKNDKELLNKEIINEPKNNAVEPSVMAYSEIIEKESIRNNNTLSNNTVTSSMDNKQNKLSYLFSSDEDDDIFFDVVDSNKNRKKSDQSNSTKSVKSRNEKRFGSKVELFDSSSDDEIFNTNKSNNNFIPKNKNKSSFSNEVKSINISKSLDDRDKINQIQETKNINKKNLFEKELTDKKHTNVFTLESEDDNDDDCLFNNTNISDGSKIVSNTQSTNVNMNFMSLSSEEYLTPISEPQYKDIFNNFPAENELNAKNEKSFNVKDIDTSQNKTPPIENTIEDKTCVYSSSDDKQQLPINSTIHNVNASSESKVNQSNFDSIYENLPIIKNDKPSYEKEINTPKNETLPTSTENIIQDKKSSILSSNDDNQQLSFNSNTQSEKCNSEIKPIPPTLDSLPENLSIIKNLESLNEKEINTVKNETESSSTENKILESKSSIFSSSEDELQLSFNSSIQNKKSDSPNNAIWPKSDLKISLKDSVDGSSFSSSNSKNEKPKKNPGKLSMNAGAFINVASLLPNSKNPITKPKISQTVASDEKITDTLSTSETKLFSAGKERVRIQVKRRPQSRQARKAIAQMSSIDIDHDEESNHEDSSCLNVSTSFDKDFIDNKSSPILQEDNLEVKNITQANNKLFVANDDQINVKKEMIKEVKSSTLDLFDDDSDPFELMTEDNSSKDFRNDHKEVKIGEKKMESKLLIGQYSDIVVNENQPKIESYNKKLPEGEPKHDKLVTEIYVEEIEGNNSKKITQSTIMPTKSNSLFDDDEDLFSVKSEKVTKLSSNIFDSDDEFEFNLKFTKKKSTKTQSIFDDDSDDDLFSTPSKPETSNLSIQKSIGNLSQRSNRSSTDGYVKLTAESVAINPLDESKNN